MSVALENVAGVDFFRHVVEAGVVAVRYDGFGSALELIQIVNHTAAEESASVFEGRLIDDNFRAFRLDALHDALDGGLAEVVAVGLHGETEDADDALLLYVAVPLDVLAVAVVACLGKHLVCDEVLAGAVGIDNRLDEVLRDIVVVR